MKTGKFTQNNCSLMAFRRGALLAGVWLAVIALLPVSAEAREFRLVMGKDRKICAHVLQLISRADVPEGGGMHQFLWELFPKPELQKGSYLFKSDKGVASRFVRFGRLDIDNDTREEVLVFENVTLRSNDGDHLLVFETGEANFSTDPTEFTLEQLSTVNGIRSFPPWPYAEHNLYLVTIGFMSYESTNYVAMWGTGFPANPEMVHAFVIARYIASPIQYSKWKSTDQLKVICEIL